MITVDEVLQILELHRVLLQGEMDIGPVIVNPDLLCSGTLAGWLVIEENHVGLNALLVKHASRKPQGCIRITIAHKTFS